MKKINKIKPVLPKTKKNSEEEPNPNASPVCYQNTTEVRKEYQFENDLEP
ncbi:MAG: hypothetical protein LBE36_03450 [Flavobacteriaceae bacterium]|jgi:hypothetical protein|nr:hypothetical protein [Flavobacteriaceae bacterium]